jgi:hypothetical protein
MNTDTTKLSGKALDLLNLLGVQTIPDFELLERFLQLNGKAAISMWLRWMVRNNGWRAAMSPVHVSVEDTIMFNYPLRVGTADIAVFHLDGTATVIELRDGTQGGRAVMGGLGQVGLYAVQLDPNKALRQVRRAVAWTPVAAPAGVNEIIAQAVIDAGGIPVCLVPPREFLTEYLRDHLKLVESVVQEAVGELQTLVDGRSAIPQELEIHG